MGTTENNVEQQQLKNFAEKAYLDYSMYVILDRALPHIADGLKPVQRRIIYAMSELGLKNTAKYKKSARTVGDVLGKYHPHGDSACYEAMVLMAQEFSYRYPLIDGQGNWGSMDDPKSFAAMRYTESRLTPYAEILLQELEQGTVSWVPNFDGTLTEPQLLPSRLPNILLNGTTGIAVGMATDIPPHNLREVVAAAIKLLDEPQATLEDLCQIIKGPDFPTGAEIITSAAELLACYRSGIGSVRVRAIYQQVDDEVVITALPYQVSGAKIQEQIAAQMQAKKLPMLLDLRDESDHENPTRLVLVLRSNRVDVEALMAHLFATTSLENSYRINLNIIGIDGKPQVKGLVQIINEWLSCRLDTVIRRLQHRLDKITKRLHLLQGFMIAYLNLDEVIRIIREADDPKAALLAAFKLSVEQAEAILEIKLRQLAKLEEFKIRSEQENLLKEHQELAAYLASPQKLKSLVKSELKEDAQRHGDPRRSQLVVRQEAKVLADEEVLAAEPVTVILSKQGWIRVAKGHEIDPATLSYKVGDSLKQAVQGRSNQLTVVLDSTGKSYALPTHKLPSARGQGEPLTSRLTPLPGATFESIVLGNPEQLVVLASDAGYGFVTKLAELYTKNRTGKALISLPTNARVMMPKLITDLEAQYLAALTNDGRMLIIPVKVLPVLNRGKGNKIIDIASAQAAKRENYLLDLVLLTPQDKLVLGVGKRSVKIAFADLAPYQGERGRRGGRLPKGLQHPEALWVEAAR